LAVVGDGRVDVLSLRTSETADGRGKGEIVNDQRPCNSGVRALVAVCIGWTVASGAGDVTCFAFIEGGVLVCPNGTVEDAC
jgi:hypothetical protein